MFGGFPAALIDGLSTKIFVLLDELEAKPAYQFRDAERDILLGLEQEAREAEMLV